MRPDIQAAIARMPSKFRIKKELKLLPEMLNQDEQVLHIGSGLYADKNAIVVATNQRVIFLAAGLLSVKDEAFNIPQISSIEMKKGMVLAKIKVTVSNQSAEMQSMDPTIARAIVDDVRAMSGPQTDPADQLLKLKQLLDSGIISEQEYAQKRQPFLDRI